MNVEAEQRAIQVRVRAERRAGQLLAEIQRAPGPGRGKKNLGGQGSFSKYANVKREAKISDWQAKQWQRLAKVQIPLRRFQLRD